jgi:hypothetical protein
LENNATLSVPVRQSGIGCLSGLLHASSVIFTNGAFVIVGTLLAQNSTIWEIFKVLADCGLTHFSGHFNFHANMLSAIME